MEPGIQDPGLKVLGNDFTPRCWLQDLKENFISVDRDILIDPYDFSERDNLIFYWDVKAKDIFSKIKLLNFEIQYNTEIINNLTQNLFYTLFIGIGFIIALRIYRELI